MYSLVIIVATQHLISLLKPLFSVYPYILLYNTTFTAKPLLKLL